ncbi:MAG: hypothetical protein O2783_04210 [Chloroflexi bacterium]|nr:hypothetical protein [Chloroflexota bacterium]
MLEKRPGPGDEYQDWEYPDPKDIEELSAIPFGDEPPSGGSRMSILLKVVGGIMLLSFVGSLLSPILGSLSGGGDQTGTSSDNTAQDTQAYELWIGSSVNAALSESGALGQVRYIGIQFDTSVRDPVIGFLVEGLDPQSSSGRDALQNYSITVLERLFADERAESVTLAWLRPVADSGSRSSSQEVVLLVGVLRNTALGIDWENLRAEDLPGVVEFYQELPSAGEGSL